MGVAPKTESEVIELAKSAGLKDNFWYPSEQMTTAYMQGYAVELDGGFWELTTSGKNYVAEKAGPEKIGPAEFNAEASVRFAKWKTAQIVDDLALMSEYDFLQICENVSVFGKSDKHELEACLKFRNGCGHPNNFVVGETRVAGHIESLILNVYSRY